ncbi:MAG TPA: flagellar basal body P-ring protein FlgI [Spirochaetota bacterium]|nr:flagellar basal body P-ring protein FlgI [Spirochaetota bacterium]
MNSIKNKIIVSMSILLLAYITAYPAVTLKLRDLIFIDGFRDNQVLGYGLVVGLQGTGDTKSFITESSLKNLLKNLGLNSDETLASKNIAAVLLTAKLPPFARIGDRIEVTVSSIGNAKSLEGGILVQSPLKGADDNIYIVAQGQLSISSGKDNKKGVSTVARIINGGLVERNIEPDFIKKDTVNLVLKDWDFSAANQIIDSIKKMYPASNPEIEKGGKIKVTIPANIRITEFISKIEEIDINPVYRSKIVINERDGTIVMGGDVKISEVMVSREGLTVKIEGSGTSGIGSEQKKGNALHMKETATIKDLVDTLNFAGASTKDTISILKALKDSGAIRSELIIK